MAMRQQLDLNCAPVELYPIIKVLTKFDMTSSQLLLPRHSVEEFIVPKMHELVINRLREGDKRADIWVVDDEKLLEHFLTMKDCDDHYLIIGLGIVCQDRELRAGQQIRFGWMDHKLHFIITAEGTYGDEAYFADSEASDEDFSERAGDIEQNEEQGQAKPMDEIPFKPPAKRRKIGIGEGGSVLGNAPPHQPLKGSRK